MELPWSYGEYVPGETEGKVNKDFWEECNSMKWNQEVTPVIRPMRLLCTKIMLLAELLFYQDIIFRVRCTVEMLSQYFLSRFEVFLHVKP